MNYKHGIEVLESPTSLAVPINGTAGLQVVFGTAPVNQVKDPYSSVNKLVLLYSFSDAVEQLGYSEDFKNYTLCQSMDASFRVFNIAPIILCNVLDPARHNKINAVSTIEVINNQAVLKEDGVLLDTIIVKKDNTALIEDNDYILSFNVEGKAVISLLTEDGVNALSVSSKSIDPTKVTKNDIIGGYDVTTGKETGMELIRQVYPKFAMTPGLLLAPGWSKYPEVGAVMATKSEEINGLFRCTNLIDLDTSTALKYPDCKGVKEDCGFTDKSSIVLWPMVVIGEKIYSYSAIYAAMTAYTDVQNDDIPSRSPSNKHLRVSGAVLENGTEISLDQNQAAVLNSEGIVTAINDRGWKSWGNNTACYPSIKDPKDRWICCRRSFSWWGNSFILVYADKVDDPLNKPLVESIVDLENIRGNNFVATNKFAGARIEFRVSDNPIDGLIDGKIVFRQFLAPFSPTEHIQNILEFDPNMIQTSLGGE